MKFLKFLPLILFAGFAYPQDSTAITGSGGHPYRPGDHELFIMPTAKTMNQGDVYFTDYEIFFLNVTYAATPRTHIGAFFLFPITTDFLETFSAGIKQNYFRTENFESALWGSFTFKNQFFTAGNVISAMNDRFGFHAAIAYIGEAKYGNGSMAFFLGTQIDFSPKIAGIVEYTNLKEAMDENFGGLISIGVRFRGESSAWELAGTRPLEETGDLLFVPYLKATFCF